MTTTTKRTFGEVLTKKELQETASTVIWVMRKISRFTGPNQIRRMIGIIIKTSDEIILRHENGELMAQAFIATFNRCDFVLVGSKVCFDLPDELWLVHFLSGLEVDEKSEGLHVFRRTGNKVLDEPKYTYRFGLQLAG